MQSAALRAAPYVARTLHGLLSWLTGLAGTLACLQAAQVADRGVDGRQVRLEPEVLLDGLRRAAEEHRERHPYLAGAACSMHRAA